jgi:hypothetical protein
MFQYLACISVWATKTKRYATANLNWEGRHGGNRRSVPFV